MLLSVIILRFMRKLRTNVAACGLFTSCITVKIYFLNPAGDSLTNLQDNIAKM